MKKIFEGILDEEVHINFLKYGRGIYENKYMLEGKKQAKKWAVKTSAEYANILVRKSLDNLKGPTKMKGVIVSTQKLDGEKSGFKFVKVSNFQGVRKHVIDSEIEPSQMIEFMENHPKAFYALTFSGTDFVLKIKPKAPASGKPGKEKEDGPTVDFCSIKTQNQDLINELFFGVTDFKEIKVKHTISVTDIVYPSNMSELKPAEIREQAKRKGVIKRIINIDGKENISEANFVA